MAALTAAPELSEGNWTDRFERITVHQRGWCLGGKGACRRLDKAVFVGRNKAVTRNGRGQPREGVIPLRSELVAPWTAF